MTAAANDVPGHAIEQAPAAAAATCPIVGIGASAGGLDALKRMLPNVAPGCGIAFIVVQHLAPDYKSILAELLALSTHLPVTQVEAATEVEPDHVYVIPPNAALTIAGGRLLLERPAHRNPIDELFVSLANDQGENAAGVILSGTGSDGTIGLRAIKEHGGLTIGQAEAEYDGMMRSALATGVVDFVVRAEEIPTRVAEYFRHVTDLNGQRGRRSVAAEAADQFSQITSLLRARTGHDFSGYKNGTIIRQVQRRMHVLQVGDVAAYIDRLRHDGREVKLLFRDLLIGVTSFFRDQSCFAALESEVIPHLFADRRPDQPVRVWVPGCATGEEAYSIAILLREQAARAAAAVPIQVFASDIDEVALEIARIGRYPASIAKDLTPERLERHFVREDGTWRVHSELREMCRFSAHNLLRDAPFSKLDLISCRNLLMYFRTDLQDRVINLFHYALGPQGYLLLGTSENVTRQTRLFAPVDKARRIFRRRPVPDRRVPEFPLVAPPAAARPRPAEQGGSGTEQNLRAMAERQLLERFAPVFVIVSAEGDLLEASARTGKYLELPAGPPHSNIFGLARPGLRLDIRTALHKAVNTGQPVVHHNVMVGVEGGRQEVDLHVQPLRRRGGDPDTPYMIVFQDVGAIKSAADAEPSARAGGPEDDAVRQLEDELRMTRERLETTAEELESSNEELKSSNEELQSMNEELQSTNEELETSKEELQSINEELQTVNAELNTRVDELSRANNDINNLLNSTQIATVFLDRALLVKGFTAAAKEVFHLVESDPGRPIMHVRPRVAIDNLHDDAERVLRTLTSLERPVSSIDGDTRYIMRMLPYRTADNVIDGVVITFTDITRITAAEARIDELTHDQQARLRDLATLLDLLPVGVMVTGPETGMVVNAYGARMLGGGGERKGFTSADMAFQLFDGEAPLPLEEQPLPRAARTGEAVHGWQGRLVDAAGRTLFVMISATPLFAEDGGVKGAIAAIVDVSAHHEAQSRQRMLLHELQHRVKNVLATIASLATRMARRPQSLDSFYDAFLSRLTAMGRVHDLLTGDAWSGAGMQPLIEAVIQPYVSAGGANVGLHGDAIMLRPTAASTLGMVLYELATNSAKYGAWSKPGGRVEVGWETVASGPGEPRLRLTWVEHGEVTGDPPSKPGFGTTFITRSVEYELTGTAVLKFTPEGLRCVIEFPVAGNLQQ